MTALDYYSSPFAKSILSGYPNTRETPRFPGGNQGEWMEKIVAQSYPYKFTFPQIDTFIHTYVGHLALNSS